MKISLKTLRFKLLIKQFGASESEESEEAATEKSGHTSFELQMNNLTGFNDYHLNQEQISEDRKHFCLLNGCPKIETVKGAWSESKALISWNAHSFVDYGSDGTVTRFFPRLATFYCSREIMISL